MQVQPLVRVQGDVLLVRKVEVPAWDGCNDEGRKIAEPREAYSYDVIDVQTSGILAVDDSATLLPAVQAIEFERGSKTAAKIQRGTEIDALCTISTRTLWRNRRPYNVYVLRFQAHSDEAAAAAPLAAVGS